MNEEFNQVQDPVIEPPTEAETQPDQEPTAPPMVVIPADELFDRLDEYFNQGDPAPEEFAEPEESEGSEEIELIEGEVDLPAADPVTAIVEQVVEHLLDMIIDLGKIEEHTAAIEGYTETVAQTLDHPALTTSFADYTVTEALLLLLLLSAFISACARMLKGGFSWLRS